MKHKWIKCSLKGRISRLEKKKQDPSICHLQKTTFRCKDTKKLKVKEWGKIIYVNCNQKKTGWLYYYQTKWTLNKKQSQNRCIVGKDG